MYSKVKTGDVIQIRKNGTNYISLGKVTDAEGTQYIAATKNGNITRGGKLKQSHNGRQPKIHIISGGEVKRVHGNRQVDIASVCSRNRALSSQLRRTDGRNGVITEAPNIMAQIQDLQAAM